MSLHEEIYMGIMYRAYIGIVTANVCPNLPVDSEGSSRENTRQSDPSKRGCNALLKREATHKKSPQRPTQLGGVGNID